MFLVKFSIKNVLDVNFSLLPSTKSDNWPLVFQFWCVSVRDWFQFYAFKGFTFCFNSCLIANQRPVHLDNSIILSKRRVLSIKWQVLYFHSLLILDPAKQVYSFYIMRGFFRFYQSLHLLVISLGLVVNNLLLP